VPGGAPVASCQWLPPIFAADATPEARDATAAATELLWESWRDLDEHDWIGVSCSHAVGVRSDGSFVPWPLTVEPGPMGWAAWPEALGHTLHRLADERSGRPLLLLTGAWDVDDERRHEDLRSLARQVAGAERDGIDLRQVHWWSAVDGYEGRHGFGVRSGLFDRARNATGVEALAQEGVGAERVGPSMDQRVGDGPGEDAGRRPPPAKPSPRTKPGPSPGC
jgi:hypothetical protein